MSNNTQAVDWKNLASTTHPVPAGTYTVLIRDVGTNPSKKGHPMATLELEILAPATVVDGGIEVKTAGRKFKHWIAFTPDRRQPYDDTQTLLAADLPNRELPSPVIPAELPGVIKQLATGKAMSGVSIVSEPSYFRDEFGNNVVDPTTGQAKVRGYNTVLKSITTAVPPSILGL